MQGSVEDRFFPAVSKSLTGSRQESTEDDAFSYQKRTTKPSRKINGLVGRSSSQEVEGCTQGTGSLTGARFLVQVMGPLLTLLANDTDRLEFWHFQHSEIRKNSPALEDPAVFCNSERSSSIRELS
jgi:hypothetical protein